MKTRTAALAAAGTVALGLFAAHAVSAEEGMRGYQRHGGQGFMHGESGEGCEYGRGPGKGQRLGQGPGMGEGRGRGHGQMYGSRGGHEGREGQGGPGGGPRFAMVFDLLDVDANNEVSRDEAMRPAEQRFARIDADKDGFITAEELSEEAGAGEGGFGPGMIERLDVDDDGQVSTAEFGVRGRAMFARADANDDGVVSHAEFASLGEGMHRGPGERFEHRGQGPRGPHGPRGPFADGLDDEESGQSE